MTITQVLIVVGLDIYAELLSLMSTLVDIYVHIYIYIYIYIYIKTLNEIAKGNFKNTLIQ